MKKAFTLIELLAVIVVIAIIALISGYAIAKVMNKAKLNSLLDTAYAVRKTTNLYLTENNFEAGIKVIDLTPGSVDANRLDVKKDPWGGTYKSIHALVIKRTNQEYEKKIFLSTSKGCYVLNNDSTELKEDNDCGGLSKYITSYDPVADWQIIPKGDHYGALYDIVSNQEVNVNRNSTKTVYDPTVNKIFNVPANQLAIRPYAATRPGATGYEMILEEARTNYVLNSSFEEDTNGDGMPNSFAAATPDPNDIVSLEPTGLHGNKTLKVSKSTATPSYVYQQVAPATLSIKTGETYTFSLWVKGENVSGSASGANFGLYVDAKYDVSSFNNPPLVAAPVGTFGWKKLSVTHTFSQDIDVLLRIYPMFRNKTGTVWFDGLQIEKGTGSTSFIPTTTTSVSRLGDQLNVPTTGWNNKNGTIMAAYVAPELTTATYQVGWNAANEAGERDINNNLVSNNKIICYNQSGSQNWGTKINGSSFNPGVKVVTPNNLVIGALTWKNDVPSDRVKQYIGGTSPSSSGSNFPQTTFNNWPTTATIGYYNNTAGTLQPNKPMHRVVIYNKQLSDDQVKVVSDQLLGGTLE